MEEPRNYPLEYIKIRGQFYLFWGTTVLVAIYKYKYKRTGKYISHLYIYRYFENHLYLYKYYYGSHWLKKNIYKYEYKYEYKYKYK